jgi:hypothetical protein
MRFLVAAALLLGLVAVPAAQIDWKTLRQLIAETPFKQATADLMPSELDRVPSGSYAVTMPDAFVAVVTFADETSPQGYLGPAHVYRVSRNGHVVRRVVEGATNVFVANGRLFRSEHRSPSAGAFFPLDENLNDGVELLGFGVEELGPRAVLYDGNMVHFAQVHQDTKWIYELDSAKAIEVFPGSFRSETAARIEAAVTETVRRNKTRGWGGILSDGEPGSFDRYCEQQLIAAGGNAFALIVHYSHDYLDRVDSNRTGPDRKRRSIENDWPVYTASTVARCARQASNQWSCSERALDLAAREYGITIPANEWPAVGRKDALEQLMQKELSRH